MHYRLGLYGLHGDGVGFAAAEAGGTLPRWPPSRVAEGVEEGGEEAERQLRRGDDRGQSLRR